MNFTKTPIEGVILITPVSFKDDRGSFMESFNLKSLAEHGIPTDFVQDNQSVSRKGVIRGLHFQVKPFEQGKLVRVTSGKAMDVVVDIRRDSPSFGKHICVELDAVENKMLWIPPGLAHGFESLEDNTVFLYKVTSYYKHDAEAGIRFDDPALSIPWKSDSPIVSKKDRILPTMAEWTASL